MKDEGRMKNEEFSAPEKDTVTQQIGSHLMAKHESIPARDSSYHTAAVDGGDTLQVAASKLHGAASPVAPSLSRLNPQLMRRMA